jgi:hypothetical protein
MQGNHTKQSSVLANSGYVSLNLCSGCPVALMREAMFA